MKAEPQKPAEHKMLLYFGPNEAHFIEADLTGANRPVGRRVLADLRRGARDVLLDRPRGAVPPPRRSRG